MKQEPVDLAIESFWRWWPEARRRIETALFVPNGAGWGTLPSEISSRVKAISPALEFEMCPAHGAQHAFCLSAAGDPVLRRITERWIRAAPEPDETWQFFPSRQPRPEMIVHIGKQAIVPAEVTLRFEVDRIRERIHIDLFHPNFVHFDEKTRCNAAFLLLDGALGEDDVERWIGEVQGAIAPLGDARPFSELSEQVRTFAQEVGDGRAEAGGAPPEARSKMKI
jgi:hypothetical protein